MLIDIEEYNDGFYYWDDTDELIGPFKTFQQAEVALSACLKWTSKDHSRNTIRKMKDNMGS